MVACAVASLAGAGVGGGLAAYSPWPEPLVTAQVYSPYCQTPSGTRCVVAPALPLGSPCACDGVGGVIVQ